MGLPTGGLSYPSDECSRYPWLVCPPQLARAQEELEGGQLQQHSLSTGGGYHLFRSQQREACREVQGSNGGIPESLPKLG